MIEVYEYSRLVNGEMRREFVVFSSEKKRDILQAVHNAAVDFCVQHANKRPCKEGGMSFAEIMEFITPEMLAPYDVTMIRPGDVAIQADQLPLLISRYELEFIRDVRSTEWYRSRRVVDYAARAAKRLEKQKAKQHPIISTWDAEKMTVKASSWACEFAMGREKNFGKFFDKKLKDLSAYAAYQEQLSSQVSDVPEPCANPDETRANPAETCVNPADLPTYSDEEIESWFVD